VRTIRILAASVLAALVLLTPDALAQQFAWSWYDVDANRNVRVNLYLFRSQSCPHCAEALRFAEQLRYRHPWLNVYSYEITSNPANRQLYQQIAASLNRIAGQTPAFFYCKQMEIGYFSDEQTGRRIEQSLVRWYEALRDHYRPPAPRAAAGRALAGLVGLALPSEEPAAAAANPPEPPDLPVQLPAEEETVYVPGWGDVEAGSLSLPTLTLVLAGCDAFNPCAFFVLLLLLSLLVHGQSRGRMLLVGGVFVFFSGLMYFLFMAAWLNLFFVIGHLGFITAAAGVVAVCIGLLNVKDFVWFKRGPSLSIPESARPGLFHRMTELITISSLPSLLVGAATLASVANLYELLCTSGFPLVYTRVLTLQQLPAAGYYGYLVLYNLVYVAPMALIVLGFTLTLGARKLAEYEGRALKLLSGMMMLALGVSLVFWPEVLHTAIGAAALLAGALGVTALIVAVDCWRQGWPPVEMGDRQADELAGHGARTS
jgi:hypothetical protein